MRPLKKVEVMSNINEIPLISTYEDNSTIATSIKDDLTQTQQREEFETEIGSRCVQSVSVLMTNN